MKVKTDYTECAYVTPGKVYELFDCDSQGGYTYLDGTCEELGPDYVLFDECAHLDCVGTWEIVE